MRAGGRCRCDIWRRLLSRVSLVFLRNLPRMYRRDRSVEGAGRGPGRGRALLSLDPPCCGRTKRGSCWGKEGGEAPLRESGGFVVVGVAADGVPGEGGRAAVGLGEGICRAATVRGTAGRACVLSEGVRTAYGLS